MRIFFSEDHTLRDARTELFGGELVPPFEAPFRAEWILAAVRDAGFRDIVPPARHGLETAAKLHTADYLEFLETAWSRWVADGYRGEAIPTSFPARRMRQHPPRDIDGALGYYAFAAETSITEGTYAAARAAMDCALSAVEHLNGGASAAFALCRPPGHHAAIDLYGGYSFINNAACAAQRLRDLGAAKVAVLDVDFHHGNGTQDIFYERGDVYFASLHGNPVDAFPYFLGFADEEGKGEGLGSTKNYPLPRGTEFGAWSAAMDDALNRIEAFGVEALVVSLGVDTFERDPISTFKLRSEDYLRMGGRLKKAGLPVVVCMEGGYGVPEIGLNVANVLKGIAS